AAGTGDAYQGQLELLAPMGTIESQRLARVLHQHLGEAPRHLPLYQGARGTQLLGGSDELMAVEVFALDGDEQLALGELAAVLVDAKELPIRAQELAAGGGCYIAQAARHGAASVSRAAVSRSL